MAKLLFEYTIEDVFDYRFRVFDNGHIGCFECTPTNAEPILWCEDIRGGMVKRWDANAIWRKDDLNGELRDQFYLEIPVFPTHNLWTRVRFTLEKNRYRVNWSEYPTLQPGEPYLCTINPGEGRQVIRTTLLDFMLGDQKRTKECKAAHHNLQAEIAWGDKDMYYQNRWSVYTEGQCLYCLTNTGLDPDLIPDQQGSGVWT